jgi:uncharacterized phiE125 gp8 family phage protein
VSVTVIQPAPSRRLTTVAAFKREIGLGHELTDDLIGNLIDQACAAIERHCGRGFARETVRETVPGYGGTVLTLSLTPVLSVTGVTLDAGSGPVAIDVSSYFIGDAGAGFLIRRSGWAWTPSWQFGVGDSGQVGSETGDYAVTYTGGYLLPGDAERDLPHDVERACLDVVKVWYGARARDAGIASESAGAYQASYRDTAPLPPLALALLAPWRRRFA